MLNVTESLKLSFLSALQKNLVLTFDDGSVIDNDDIALESMSLEQTLCDKDELRYGKVASACFKTKIKASTKTYKNLWFNASIFAGEHEMKLGRFKVYSDNMTSDRLYRDIVAYDALFWAINTDLTEWYTSLVFPISLKAFRDSAFDKLGIEQLEVELPNDNLMLEKSVEAENLTGLTVLQAICEMNATWGTINSDGLFKYVRMRTQDADALYPSDDLYPSDELFPNDIYDDVLVKGGYYQGTLKYEEYDTQPITKVVIRENAEDAGYAYGTDGNTYVIEANFLLYGASTDSLHDVAKNFFDYAQYITYTPSELQCKGAPWREIGDLLQVVADKRVLTVPILNRTISGITALKDTYVAKGQETYGEMKNNAYEQIKQLQGRTNKLVRDLDGTRSEVAKKVDGEDVVSVINQSAEEILLKGNRIVIESTNFELLKDGSILIKAGTIDVKGSVTKYASNYSKDDADRINNIILGNISPNSEDYEKYDLNGDGIINISDLVICNHFIQGTTSSKTFDTSVKIGAKNEKEVIKLQNVAIGSDCVRAKYLAADVSRARLFGAKRSDGTYESGTSGTFSTPDGKTVTVIGGIITSIV